MTSVKEADIPAPMNGIENLLSLSKQSVFMVKSRQGVQGTAAFYSLEKMMGTCHCLITCMHVLECTSIEDITEAKLVYNSGEPFQIQKEWIVRVVSLKSLDAIIIEIHEEAANILKNDNKINFFSIKKPQIGCKVF